MCRYLSELTAALETALAPQPLTALYLTGSAAVGAYVEGVSDVDVIAVVADAPRPALERVVAACAHEALPCPATKLELVVYERTALARADARPRWSLNFNTGAAVHHAGFDPEREPAHWFVVDLAFARRHAVALVGPAPAGLIPELDDASVEAAFGELVRWYEDHEPDHAPTARARADHWRATGEFAPKQRG